MAKLMYGERGVQDLRLGWVKQVESDIEGPYHCFVRISQKAGT